MAVTTVPNPQPPATPEEVWTILQETDRLMREAAEERKEERKETDRLMREAAEELREERRETDRRMRETDRLIKELRESQKETGIKIAELSKNVGGLNNSIGGVIETLIAARLWEKFSEYDMRRAYQRIRLYDENVKAIAEIDILLVNTEWTMAVEVKREADKGDVNDHIVRMKRILQYPTPLIPPQAKLLGAIAAGVITPEAAAYAHECGFFVLELAGESVVRVPAPAGFQPKEWREATAAQ